MKQSIILFFLIFICTKINAQTPKTQIGFNLSNSIFTSTTAKSENFETKGLLSFSAGLIIRHNLKEKKKKGKRNYFNTANHGGLFFNYGINILRAGYEYEFEKIRTHTNQTIIEFPIFLTMKFTNDFYMSRKLIKKGYGSYINIGLTPSLIPIETNIKEINKQEIQLIETLNNSGFNYTPSFGFGVDRVHKNGSYSSIGLSANFGINKRTNVALEYEDNSNQIAFNKSFSVREIYFSINLIHLISTSKIKLRKGVPPPIIYNPRYLSNRK